MVKGVRNQKVSRGGPTFAPPNQPSLILLIVLWGPPRTPWTKEFSACFLSPKQIKGLGLGREIATLNPKP